MVYKDSNHYMAFCVYMIYCINYILWFLLKSNGKMDPQCVLFLFMHSLTTHPGIVVACTVLHPNCFSPAQQMRAEWFAWEEILVVLR